MDPLKENNGKYYRYFRKSYHTDISQNHFTAVSDSNILF